MPTFDPDKHLPVETYQEALQAFHMVAGIVLFEFAIHGAGNRDVIIRNLIARADTSSRAIFQLWTMEDYQDCWVLHRCLMDRLFHLRHLNDGNSFDTFEAWSFLKQYKAKDRAINDLEVQGTREHDLFAITDEQKQRADILLANPPKWHRPKAEEVAKAMGMRFLYRYGYDFASAHIHPMADDGDQDFHTITKLEPLPEALDQRTILANTLLVATMLVQEGMNASTLKWRQLVYGVLEDLRLFVGSGSTDYRLRLLTLVSARQQGTAMCEPGATSKASES